MLIESANGFFLFEDGIVKIRFYILTTRQFVHFMFDGERERERSYTQAEEDVYEGAMTT